MERDEEVKDELEQKMLGVIAGFPDGIRDSEFDKVLQIDKRSKLEALTNLERKKRIAYLETKGGEVMYKALTKEKRDKYKGLHEEELVIYQLLEEASNKGLSARDIKDKISGLNTNRINKILGALIEKQLIKFYKSIQAKKKKVYMLAEVEPSTEITGGTWYTENEFDAKLIDVLCKKCLSYIEKQGTAGKKEITFYIKNLGLFQREIKEADIESILNTLYFDDEIEIARNSSVGLTESATVPGKTVINYSYKIKKKFIPEIGLLHIPCSYCPITKDCHPDGIINPSTCQYLREWLEEEKPEDNNKEEEVEAEAEAEIEKVEDKKEKKTKPSKNEQK